MKNNLKTFRDNIQLHLHGLKEDNSLIIYFFFMFIFIMLFIALYSLTSQKLFLIGIGLILSLTALFIALENRNWTENYKEN